MNARVPFLQWKPLHFGLTLLTLVVIAGIIVGLYHHPIKTILFVVMVIIAIIVAGKINKAADDVERAKNWRNRPVGKDEILSFSLEKEMREKKE